jgi:hypothetical protein
MKKGIIAVLMICVLFFAKVLIAGPETLSYDKVLIAGPETLSYDKECVPHGDNVKTPDQVCVRTIYRIIHNNITGECVLQRSFMPEKMKIRKDKPWHDITYDENKDGKGIDRLKLQKKILDELEAKKFRACDSINNAWEEIAE